MNQKQQWWEDIASCFGEAYANATYGQQTGQAFAQQESQQRVSEVAEVRRCGNLMLEARERGWTARVLQYETLGFCVQFKGPKRNVISGPLRLGLRAALMEGAEAWAKEMKL